MVLFGLSIGMYMTTSTNIVKRLIMEVLFGAICARLGVACETKK